MLISPHRDRPDSPHYIKTLSPAQHQELDKPSQQEKPPHTPPRQLLPVKHACSGRGCIRDQSFPGNDSLKQHLLLGRVRHWCLPELGHTALPGSGFTGQSWNYPCRNKNRTEGYGSAETPAKPQCCDKGQQDTPASGCP